MKYRWGEEPVRVRRAAGSIHDVRPGTGGNPLRNLAHPVLVPIARATVRLQSVRSGEVQEARSDEHGVFAFDGVQSGTYVLHVEGGTAGPYDATRVVLAVGESARSSGMVLHRLDAGAGACGNSLRLSTVP